MTKMRLSLFSTNILAVGAFYQGRRNCRLLHQQFSIEDDGRGGDMMNHMMKAIQQGVDPDAIDLLPVSTGKDSQTSSKHPRFGVWAGIDDPRDAPWRLETEEVIKAAVKNVGDVELYDITWNVADIQVFITAVKDGGLTLDDVVSIHHSIIQALEFHEDELNILGRYNLEVSSRGVPDILTSERDFEAFRGFDVVVSFAMPDGTKMREPLLGRLVKRDIHETTLSVKGRMVRIPNYLCAAVSLPKTPT